MLNEWSALCLSSSDFIWKLLCVFCFYLTYNVSLKEIQWDNFEFIFTGASFKTNSGLTLLYAVTLVYFCTYFCFLVQFHILSLQNDLISLFLANFYNVVLI